MVAEENRRKSLEFLDLGRQEKILIFYCSFPIPSGETARAASSSRIS